MSSSFPLAELTTTLMREVFESINSSADEQNAAFADLSAQVGVPLDAYADRLIGSTDGERLQAAEAHVRAVIVPVVLPGLRSGAPLPDPLALSVDGRRWLIDHFRGVTADLGTSAAPRLTSIEEEILAAEAEGRFVFWRIGLSALLAFSLARLRRDAERSYQKTRALLAAGLSRVSILGGQIETKMTLSVVPPAAPIALPAPAVPSGIVIFDEPVSRRTRFPGVAVPMAQTSFGRDALQPLRLQARIANESTPAIAKAAELAGSIRIEFRIGSYPPVEPFDSSS